jgi:queuosine precursor transporter
MSRISSRAWWAVAAFATYAAAIATSNWLITRFGVTPVGFGLIAPAGVWAAAVSFPARDITQRMGGRWLGIAAILGGAALSWALSSSHLAVASGVTYLCSETLDMAVYTPLQRRWFVPAVIASGCAAIVLDSVLFLHLAGLYSVPLVEGLILGKFWVIAAAGPAAWALRNKGPVAVQAHGHAPEGAEPRRVTQSPTARLRPRRR